jgi:hypothetical protein
MPPSTSAPSTSQGRRELGDSPALTLTSVFNSVAGLLGFLIAAWVMPQNQVGRATECRCVAAIQRRATPWSATHRTHRTHPPGIGQPGYLGR